MQTAEEIQILWQLNAIAKVQIRFVKNLTTESLTKHHTIYVPLSFIVDQDGRHNWLKLGRTSTIIIINKRSISIILRSKEEQM